MATITLRVDERTKNELEGAARARGMTVSDVVRGYIEDRHKLSDPDAGLADAAAPQTMTLMDRHVLALLHRVLEIQGDSEYTAGYHGRAAEVLRMGYTTGYDREFAGYAREMPREQARLVWAILDMFRVIKASLRRLPEEERVSLSEDELRTLEFEGFDGNDSVEAALLSYASFAVEREGRWSEFRSVFEESGGNSHAQMLGRYNRMLEEFEPIRKKYVRSPNTLSIDDLRALASV